MQGNLAITTARLVRRFGDITAVNGVSLEIERGEVFGLLGHNGAGKTTTVRLLNGVLRPTAGSLRVLDFDPVTEGPVLRRRTGILTESPSLDERLSARENLVIYARLYDVPETQVNQRVDDLMEQFELSERADDKAGGYSKGMKQRLALARALLHQPELVFLDEPTAGLDPVAARQVHDLIQSLRAEGRTALLCTHNLIEAQKLCDRVAVLEHGKVLAVGTTGDLARRFAHKRVVVVEVSEKTLPAALKTLCEMRGLTDIEAINGHTVVFSGAGHDTVPDVVALLAAAGVRIYRVVPQEPSLEDVYFALHGEVPSATGEKVIV
jgi:ABC-2 type transport system ATP-binding protein